MSKFIFVALIFSFTAHAESGTVSWPSRNSKVICGAMVDGESLDFHVVVPGELLGSSSKDERILLYVDLHKAGQVHLAFVEALTDDEYDQREAAMTKLSPEEAELMRALTASRQNDLYAGITPDRFVHLETIMKKRTLSVSCQEIL